MSFRIFNITETAGHNNHSHTQSSEPEIPDKIETSLPTKPTPKPEPKAKMVNKRVQTNKGNVWTV